MLFISSAIIAQHAYSHACASSSPTGAPVEPSREDNDSNGGSFASVSISVQELDELENGDTMYLPVP